MARVLELKVSGAETVALVTPPVELVVRSPETTEEIVRLVVEAVVAQRLVVEALVTVSLASELSKVKLEEPANAPLELYCTSVSLPLAGVSPVSRQAPSIAKQPSASEMPFAKVEVALPVTLSAVVCTPAAKVEVELPCTTKKPVVVAPPLTVSPVF